MLALVHSILPCIVCSTATYESVVNSRNIKRVSNQDNYYSLLLSIVNEYNCSYSLLLMNSQHVFCPIVKTPTWHHSRTKTLGKHFHNNFHVIHVTVLDVSEKQGDPKTDKTWANGHVFCFFSSRIPEILVFICFFVGQGFLSTPWETNVSHLWKRKIIFPATFKGNMLVPCRVSQLFCQIFSTLSSDKQKKTAPPHHVATIPLPQRRPSEGPRQWPPISTFRSARRIHKSLL